LRCPGSEWGVPVVIHAGKDAVAKQLVSMFAEIGSGEPRCLSAPCYPYIPAMTDLGHAVSIQEKSGAFRCASPNG